MSGEKDKAPERPRKVWWLWLGWFYCGANALSAIIQLREGDLFLFLLGTLAAVFVGQVLWNRRGYLFDPDEYGDGGHPQ